MTRATRVLLEDILDSLDRIQDYTSGVSEGEFRARPLLQDAVLYRIMIVGEAVKGLPADVRGERPEIDWTAIAGMRDVLIHEYFRVDLALAWQVMQRDLPELRAQIARLLAEDD